MKIITAIGVLLTGAGLASAQITTTWNSGTLNANVPQGNTIGQPFSTTLSGISETNITDITVSLNFLTPDGNGSIYAYLVGPGGQAVLINNPGQQAGSTLYDQFGYQDGGFDITLNDSAGNNNVHFYQNDSYSLNGSQQLTGAWASDGETQDPTGNSSTFGTGLGAENLTSLYGTNPNGTWTLYLADLQSSGGSDTLASWGLTVVTAPEPANWEFIGIGLVSLLAISKLRRKNPFASQQNPQPQRIQQRIK